jgi:hypothetical protein
MIAQQVGGKATRDALFLSRFPATDLPLVVMATAVLALVAAVLLSQLVARAGPARIVPLAFLLSAISFVAEWALLPWWPDQLAVVVYLHVGAGSAVLISGFWSLAGERLDPHSARPAIARIAAFSALGGVVGGLTAERVSAFAGVPAMLGVLGIAHACCALAVAGFGRESAMAGGPAALSASAVPLLRSRAYLQMMALLVCLCAVIDTLLDYALKYQAAVRLGDAESLARFFAIFYTGTSLVAFVLQASLGPHVTARLGVAGSVAFRPAVVATLGLVAAAATNLVTVALLRGAEFLMANSLFRSGFELLYAPIAPAAKRATKTTIDVGGQRLGDLVGGLMVLGLLAIAPKDATVVVVVAAVVVAAAALAIARRLGRLHLRELGRSLRAGLLSTEDPGLDPVTRGMVRTIALNPRALRARIRRSEANEQLAVGRVLEARRGAGAHWEQFGMPRDLVAVLLDPSRPPQTRKDVAARLGTIPDRTALEGLVLGLGEADFELRLACARAATAIVARRPDLLPKPKRIYDVLRREMRAGREAIENRGRPADDAKQSALLDPDVAVAVPIGIEYVFTLLALIFGVEMIASVLRAIYSGDRKLSGTALEYLHAALPDSERQALWPLLGAIEPTAHSLRIRA